MRNRQVSTCNHEKLKSPFKKKTKQTKNPTQQKYKVLCSILFIARNFQINLHNVCYFPGMLTSFSLPIALPIFELK